MSNPHRKFYSKEFKIEAVKLVTENGYKAQEAAKNLGVSASSISKWKRQLCSDGPVAAFPGKGCLKPLDAELRDLRRELERTKRERDILKKAVAYFAEPLK